MPRTSPKGSPLFLHCAGTMQTMEEAAASVPEELRVWLFAMWNAIASKKKINPKYQQSLGKVSQKTKEAVKEFYGKNISRQIIKTENLRHIYDRHGKYPNTEIKNSQIPITAETAALIPDVLASPDNIRKGERTKKTGYETVVISKEYADGSVHIVDAILKNNILEVYTAYIWNKEKSLKKRLAYGSSETGSNSAIPPQ